MNRGARRAAVFGEAWVCQLFLEVLAELPKRFGIQVLAYAIMPNHYHLLLRCPLGNLSLAMQYLGQEFTQRLNRRLEWDGPVFRGRFTSRLVEDDGYLAHLFAYIHANPVKAGFSESVDAARWTSHRALTGRVPAPTWLDPNGLNAAFGTVEAYRQYVEDYCGGNMSVPRSWEPGRLWIPAQTVAPDLAPAVRVTDPIPYLAAVAVVTGTTISHLLEPVRGRNGNPERALAAWWLARQTHETNAVLAVWLEARPARISQLRAWVEKDNARFAAWRIELMVRAEPANDPVMFVRDSWGQADRICVFSAYSAYRRGEVANYWGWSVEAEMRSA